MIKANGVHESDPPSKETTTPSSKQKVPPLSNPQSASKKQKAGYLSESSAEVDYEEHDEYFITKPEPTQPLTTIKTETFSDNEGSRKSRVSIEKLGKDVLRSVDDDEDGEEYYTMKRDTTKSEAFKNGDISVKSRDTIVKKPGKKSCSGN